MYHNDVAPFTGAWIEINKTGNAANISASSHPSRVRGLKYRGGSIDAISKRGRTLHGCVD
mgnify:CR=1 FL=1